MKLHIFQYIDKLFMISKASRFMRILSNEFCWHIAPINDTIVRPKGSCVELPQWNHTNIYLCVFVRKMHTFSSDTNEHFLANNSRIFPHIFSWIQVISLPDIKNIRRHSGRSCSIVLVIFTLIRFYVILSRRQRMCTAQNILLRIR